MVNLPMLFSKYIKIRKKLDFIGMVTLPGKSVYRKYVKNIGNSRRTNGCATWKYGKIDEKILDRLYKNTSAIMENVDIDNKALVC